MNRIAAFFEIITKGLIFMQIRESGKWIELVRTAYRPAELVVLPDGGKAYLAGTGRSVPQWKARVPAATTVLPPNVAAQLLPEELRKAESWLADRAERRQDEMRDKAMREVAGTMALAAEGYKKSGEAGDGDRLTPEMACAIWRAWQPLRAELQKRGIQERDSVASPVGPGVPEAAPSRRRRGKGAAGPAADAPSGVDVPL